MFERVIVRVQRDVFDRDIAVLGMHRIAFPIFISCAAQKFHQFAARGEKFANDIFQRLVRRVMIAAPFLLIETRDDGRLFFFQNARGAIQKDLGIRVAQMRERAVQRPLAFFRNSIQLFGG